VTALVFVACAATSRANNVKPQPLSPAIIKALSADEASYCDQFAGSFKKGCHQTFRKNLLWRRIAITLSGQTAILVESVNMGSCGSAGCSLKLFVQQRNGRFVQILGTQGDVGHLERIKVLTNVTNGHYDLQKTWADGNAQTTYQWHELRYSPE
jgi:hypothetical protein